MASHERKNYDQRQYKNGWPTRGGFDTVRPTKKHRAQLLDNELSVQRIADNSGRDGVNSLLMRTKKDVMMELAELERLFDDEKCPSIEDFLKILKSMAEKDLVIVSSVDSERSAEDQATGEMPIVVAGTDSETARASGAKISSVREIYNHLNEIWVTIQSFDQVAKRNYFTRQRIQSLMRAFRIPDTVGAELSELLHPPGNPTRNALKMRFLGLLLEYIKTEAKTPTSRTIHFN